MDVKDKKDIEHAKVEKEDMFTGHHTALTTTVKSREKIQNPLKLRQTGKHP